MDFQLCCGSSLPQDWAIEALACSNHVKTSLLIDLLKKIPQNSKHIGKKARELVSLKFLESLFIQGARANPVSSSLCKTVRLDPSDHCEDVLRRILYEISLSHLKPAGLEISKWDLEPFIEHKRSNLPKYALKQLKDAILTGSHSISASFLTEQRDLLAGSHAEHQAPARDDNCNGIIPRVEGSDTDDGNLVPVNKKRRASESPAEQLCTIHINPVKKNKPHVISNEQNVGEQLQMSDTSSTVSVQNIKAKGFSFERKTHVGNMGLLEPPMHDTNECTSSGLGEHNEVLLRGKQVPHCDTELNNKYEDQQRQYQNIKEGGKNEICNLKKTNEDVDQFELCTKNVNEVEEDVHVSDDNDGNDDGKTRDQNLLADTSKRCSKVRYSLEEETCVEVMRQNGSPGDGNNQCKSLKWIVWNVHIPQCGTEVLTEKIDVAMQNSKGENTENREKGFHGLISTNEDIDKFDQDVPRTSPTVGEAEEDVDISSDNDGYDDERATIDTMKKTFLSSQCTYSENSLARTDLRELNLCRKCNKGGNVLSCTSDSCPTVIHESCLGSDASFDIREPFYCPFCAYSRAISKYEEVKKCASLARKDLTTFICLGPQNVSTKRPIDGNSLKQNDGLPKGNELNQTNVIENDSNHQRRRKLKFEKAGHSELHSDYSPPFGRKATVATGGLVQRSKRDEHDGKRREESQPPRGRKQKPITTVVVHNPQKETKYCQVSETGGSEKHADVRPKKGVPRPPETHIPCESKCSQSSQSTDVEEVSEDETEDSGTSKYFIKVREQGRQNLYPAIPQLRRKRLRWTSEEEDTLKKGMHLFFSPHDKIIPWKKILEFGEGKFEPSRSTIDLKDKWRNMCKASPKSK